MNATFVRPIDYSVTIREQYGMVLLRVNQYERVAETHLTIEDAHAVIAGLLKAISEATVIQAKEEAARNGRTK